MTTEGDVNAEASKGSGNPSAVPPVPPTNQGVLPNAEGQPADSRVYVNLNVPDRVKPTEVIQIVVNGGLAAIGILALCIYWGQLNAMKGQLTAMNGQLTEIRKQYPELRKSADAANSAAITANLTLKSQERSFHIDQRPYLVSDIPQFVNPTGPVAGQKVQVDVNIKNIGKTPARRVVWNVSLKSYRPTDRPAFLKFLSSIFGELKSKTVRASRELKAFPSEQDIAPNATLFSTSQDEVIIGAKELPDLQTGNIALFFTGTIIYSDSSEAGYQTDFCYFYFGAEPKTWHICDAFNAIK